MGYFNKLAKLLRYSDTAGFTGGALGTGMALASPFGGNFQLSPVIAKDLGLPYGASVTALDAYKVPSISRAMALLCGAAANCTFKNEDGTPAPDWLNATDDAITPGMRTAALVADLIFYREAVWFVGRDGAGAINGALHLPRDCWTLNPDGNVLVNGQVMPAANVLYFQSLRPMGLLTSAADTVDNYLDISRTIRSRGKNPIPMLEIHVTEDFAGTGTELEQVVTDWSAARKSENGAVAVTPHGIELKTPGAGGSGGEWLIEARNAVRLDVANFTNLPAAMLEGNSGASGTYENTLQNKDEFVSLSLAEWLLPIQQRLSQPDACAVPVVLDTSKFIITEPAAGNTGTAVAGTGSEPAAIEPAGTAEPAALTVDDVLKLSNGAAALIRSGFDPTSTLAAMGLPAIEHLGLLPVTVQKPVDPTGAVDEEIVDDLTGDDAGTTTPTNEEETNA